MDGVLIYPSATMNELPMVGGELEWEQGPLARLDETGMPAEPVTTKIVEELPSGLQSALERSHIDLWDSPIQVGDLDIIGFEFVSGDDQGLAPALLMVHFVSNSDNLERLGRLKNARTKPAREFLTQVAPGFFVNPLQSRGFAIVAQEGEPRISVQDGVFVVESENPKLQSLLHGRLTLSLQLAVTQFFALQMGLLTWPSMDDSNPTWDDFHQTMSHISQKLIWPKISLNADAQLLYEGVRASLGIESTLNQVLADVDRRNQIVQAKSAQALNSYGLVVAVSGLSATWIGIGVATTSPIGTICGLLTLVAAGWVKYRNRKLL